MDPAHVKRFDIDRGDERGVLCIHGFTGTPYEVQPLGERLAAAGFTAVGPWLPGHGADPAALNGTGWRDWTAAMADELAALRRRCRRVAVVGMSLGGLITLHLAARIPDIRAIAVLGTPLWLSPWVSVFSRLMPLRSVRKAGPDVSDPAEKRGFPTLPFIPVRALRSLLDFMPRVRAELPLVRMPTLVLHGDNDHVAPPACAPDLLWRLGAAEKRLVALPRSFHIITVDVERELVAREVGDFLAERT